MFSWLRLPSIPVEVPHLKRAERFFAIFSVLVLVDIALFIWHAYLFCRAWYANQAENVLGVVVATNHFLANSIAIADLFIHLWRYIYEHSCDFEPSKSTNCFLYSLVGAYAGKDNSGIIALGWAMVGQSLASAMVSIAIFTWGLGVARDCEEKNGGGAGEKAAKAGRAPRHYPFTTLRS